MLGLSNQEELAVRQGPKRLAMAFQILEFAVRQKRSGATCDEVVTALGLYPPSASVRYSELVKSGCLVATTRVRPTTSKGVAKVHVAASRPNFKKYMQYLQRPVSKRAGLSLLDSSILYVGKAFCKRWTRAKTSTGRENASRYLINTLVGLALPCQ